MKWSHLKGYDTGYRAMFEMHVDVVLMVVGEGAGRICAANQQYAFISITEKATKPCNVVAGVSHTK